MTPRMPVNFIGFLVFVLYLLIAMALLRLAAAKYSDTTAGKALGALVA